jgi:hypothetical protein
MLGLSEEVRVVSLQPNCSEDEEDALYGASLAFPFHPTILELILQIR